MQEKSALRLWKAKMAVGRMSYEQGLFDKAAHHFRAALHILESENLPSDLRSRTLVDLAKSLGSVGQFTEGEELLKEALSLDQKDSASPAELAEDFHQLSLLYWRGGKFEESELACRQAFELLDKSGNEFPDELKAKLLKHKAVLAELRGDYCGAEKTIEEALSFISQSRQLDRFSAIYGDSLMVKIIVLTEENRFDEARELYPEAIKVLEVSRGETHTKTLAFLKELSELARKKGLAKSAAFLDAELSRAKTLLKMKGGL